MTESDEFRDENDPQTLQKCYRELVELRNVESNPDEYYVLTTKIAEVMRKLRDSGYPIDNDAVRETRKIEPSALERFFTKYIVPYLKKRQR